MRFEKSSKVVPRTQLTSIFEGQPFKTRPFPIKTRVIWVLGYHSFQILEKTKHSHAVFVFSKNDQENQLNQPQKKRRGRSANISRGLGGGLFFDKFKDFLFVPFFLTKLAPKIRRITRHSRGILEFLPN